MATSIDYKADVGARLHIAKEIKPCAYCGAPFVTFIAGAYGDPMHVAIRHPAAGRCALVNHTFPYDDETVALLNRRPGDPWPVLQLDAACI